MKHPRYQDYVIRDGQFVGDFDAMYREHNDPWNQSEERHASEKAVALNWIERLQPRSVVEIGCGHGHFTRRIAAICPVVGLDISAAAIDLARASHGSVAAFEVASIEDHAVFKRLAPDVIVMAEVTWYVLPQLRAFVDFLRAELPRAHLIHLLTTYAAGVQKYGADYFTDLPGILRFFGMKYLETGEVRHPSGEARTWFIGR